MWTVNSLNGTDVAAWKRCIRFSWYNEIIIIIINLLAQKHDKVKCETKQIERDRTAGH